LQARAAFLVGAQEIVHGGHGLAPDALARADSLRIVTQQTQVNHEA
jgi:hypothetical protein